MFRSTRGLSCVLVLVVVLLLTSCGYNVTEAKTEEDHKQETIEDAVLDKVIPEDIIVLDISELLSAQESDIEKAKEMYEKRWIELTGKVVSVTHGEYREATRTFNGKTSYFEYGETRYEINGVTIESALIYWLAARERFEQADVIVEMDIFFCQNDEKTGYVYYPQNSKVTIVAYCAAIGEKDIVFTDGRYNK